VQPWRRAPRLLVTFDKEEEEKEEEKDIEEETNKADLEFPKNIIRTVPDSPDRPSTPLQRKRTYTLVSRTPTKPATPPRPPPAKALTPVDIYELPVFTVPPRLA
jgi:hypothetical protein